MNNIIKVYNRLNTIFLIFIIICANYLGFQLYGGEEQYFAFAKQFMNPDWIPGSFSLTHPAGGNLFFEIIAGIALKYLTFEQLAFWGRLVNFFLLSIPLALIFRHFKLTNIQSTVLFQLFFLPHQSIFAGEWIFQNFEVKTLAYIFVLWGLYSLLKGKTNLFALYSALGTLFHFLVGGWFMVIGIILLFYRREELKKILKSVLIYIGIISPFIIYLANLYLINNPSVINGINTNRIYCYERLPFHLGLFKSMDYFIRYHLDGVLITLGLFALCLFWFRRYRHPGIRLLNQFNIILFSQQLLFLIVAYFDKNGVLLKIYPFRTSTLSSLLILIEITLIIEKYSLIQLYACILQRHLNNSISVIKSKILTLNTRINFFFFILLLFFVMNETVETIQGKNTDVSKVNTEMQELMAYIRENTDKKAVFLLLVKNVPLSFHRTAERENFVVWKFTPTKSQAIYEIYDRRLVRNKISRNISQLDKYKKKYRIDYIISDSTINTPLIQLERNSGKLRLYSIK